MEKTYQMLWDCNYCGQKKLLGLSHRFCPGCGAPQNAALRYYPSDAEKVAVEDHRYAGADVQCRACQSYCSKLANNCVGCGAPMAGGREVATRGAQAVASGGAFQGGSARDAQAAYGGPGAPPPMAPQPARGRSSKVGLTCGLIVAVIVGMGMIGLFCWKKDGAFEVRAHTWERSIAIETFGPVRQKAWCDDLPAGAKVVGRTSEKRSTKKVADGQECRMVRKDMGDGTYKENEQCSPRYKDEPVYDDRCEYEVNQWKKTRDVVARGASVNDEPRWPDPGNLREGSCVGCERQGSRTEAYKVHFREVKGGAEQECIYTRPETWASFAPGSRWRGKQAVLTGSIDCESLRKE